jgi:hypothetical protein
LSNQSDPAFGRVKRPAILLLVLSTLLAALGVSIGGVAMADTTPTPGPDINTRAVLAPDTASQTHGSQPPATFNGAVEGTTVSIHVDGPSGNFFGVNAARMCKGGLNVTNNTQMNTTSGNCVPAAFGASDDFFKQVSAAPSNTAVDFTFRVGQGTQSWTDSGGSHTVTCDITNPCSVWLWESVDTSISSSGNIFHHYDITYAGTPGSPGLAVTPGNAQLQVTLSAPTNTGNSSQPLSYTVTLSGGNCGTLPAGSCGPKSGTGTSYTFTGLTNNTTYTVSATATSTAADGTTTFTSAPATATGTPAPPPGPNVQQSISASRPQGALVLTQVCGDHGPTQDHPAAATHSSPDNPGVSGPPLFGTNADPLYANPGGAAGYPYPEDAQGNPVQANYPTLCNVDLGKAHLVTTGTDKGKFFEATGVLSQVTVVDARDADPGFTVNGQMSALTGSATHSTLSGSELGWRPAAHNASAFTDSGGNVYDQNVVAGNYVAPNTPDASGLSNSGATQCDPYNPDGTPHAAPGNCGTIGLAVLGSAAGRTTTTAGSTSWCPASATSCASGGLGIATLDADLDLYIPIFAKADTYTGTLTISAI